MGSYASGEELATTQGGGEQGCESADWPSQDYFRAGNSSKYHQILVRF
jgi:hypothetical protein